MIKNISLPLLFSLIILCGSCSTNYLVLSEEGTGKLSINGSTRTFKVPSNKGIKVKKKSKTCFKLFWGSRYIGILCDPDIKFFGKEIPDGVSEINIEDFLKMENEKKGGENTSYETPRTNERKYETGPRGGQYYINSKGNKVYKRKSK